MFSYIQRSIQIIFVVFISMSVNNCGGGDTSSPENSRRVGAPLNFAALPGNGVVLLTWTRPNSAGTPDYYILEKSIDSRKTFAIVSGNILAGDLTYTDTNAQNNIVHVYRLAAVNEVGRGSWSVSDRVMPEASLAIDLPGAPQNVIATTAASAVTLRWEIPITGGEVASYRVERTIGTKAKTIISGKIPATTTTFTDPNAEIGQTHVYRVSAANSRGFYGVPGLSNEVIPVIIVSGAPSAPQNFSAIAGDSTVTLKWKPAPVGGKVIYFKVDKSIDNKATFIPVDSAIANNIFTLTDSSLTNGDSYVYCIAAGNAVGESATICSNIAIPTLGNSTTTRTTLISNKPGDFYNFGNALTFSPDGTTLVIGEVTGNATASSLPGAVQLFNKVNNNWTYSQTLTSPATGAVNSYGFAVAFSPDGLFLAVAGEYNPVTGDTVYLYTKLVDNWVKSQSLTLTGIPSTGFGSSLSFNADNTSLAIGEKNGLVNGVKAGVVHIYSLQGQGTWTSQQILLSQAAAEFNAFGAIVRFSPDGNTLAVGETKGEAATSTDAGTVQIFTKPATTWTYLETLISDNPNSGNYFGADNKFNNEITFSPDSQTLAIGESLGDSATKPDSGKLHLFTKSATTWTIGQLTLTSPATSSRGFGNSVSFSADGQTLAIGESNGGASQVGIVHLYTFATTANATWTFSKRLTALFPNVRNRFGSNVVFSPVGNSLAVSEIRGDTDTIIDAGVVDVINLSPGL